MKEFIDNFITEDTQIEFTSIKNWEVKVITKEEAIKNKDSNIYYLPFVRLDLKYVWNLRAKDSDIIKTNKFVIDIDLRNNLDYEITNDDIMDIADTLKQELETIEYLNEWSYIIFSWNWLHIYYIWDFITVTPEEFSNWIIRIFNKWDEIFWSPYESDHACRNIWRIFRLPWSVNQKNWAEVKILYQQEVKSSLVSRIPYFAEKTKKELEIENIKRLEETKAILANFSADDSKFYDIINKQIPAYQIAQLLVPQFPYNWKKNFKNEKGWLTWYYYVKENNTICNWWSRYFLFDWDVNSCWNNFSLVKKSKWFTNAETFRFFKELLNYNK